MGNKKGITLEEALKMLEAANSIIQSQQKEISDQQLKIDAQSSVIHSKDLQIRQQEVELKQNQIEIEKKNLEILQLQEKLATQLRYRFCARSEKAELKDQSNHLYLDARTGCLPDQKMEPVQVVSCLH
ncbi:hypothetical protein SAMN04487977_101419 [Treponema bryantii]|uniref:Uncharacterized protein n=1 Tax=Treponema bryantii TaxID=163 RepID=A0A1H9AQE1_9SPIR|nr:hypothetical protein [Treponema bryantii]SEP78687.1 hypothetical protein SAMN04487977_101419 [Treponema bryantii]